MWVADGKLIACESSLGIEPDFAHRQRLAHFHELAHCDNVFICRGLAQEVDRQAGGDRHWNDADLTEDRNVKRDVGDRHEHGPSDRSTRSQFVRSDIVGDDGAGVGNFSHNALGLRELGGDERGDLFGCGHDDSPQKPVVWFVSNAT
jgi:hypothetical protein